METLEKEFVCRLKIRGSGGGFVTRYTVKVKAKNPAEAFAKAEERIKNDPFARQFYPAEGAEIECEEALY